MGFGNNVCLYESSGYNYEAGLDEEGCTKGAACFGVYESGFGEDEAAQEEAYGYNGLDPAVRGSLRLVGGAEGEEDGVSWLRSR
jgi:hypothetical protein